MIGEIITAGAGLIGALFGRKKEQKTTSEIDYVKMRQNAEAAGFNPLTALRAGGGAGFTTTHHPALASGDFIAQAIGGIGNAIASIDPMRDATAKLEHQIKQATLANIQADTASRTRATQSIGGAPVSTGARNVRVSSPLAQKPLPASAGLPMTPTVEVPTVTNPNSLSSGRRVDPNQPDVEHKETRYGDSEFWSTIDGTLARWNDYVYNSFQQTLNDGLHYKKLRNDALTRKSKAREELRRNDAFFKRHGF